MQNEEHFMRRELTCLAALVLVGIGYVLGAAGFTSSTLLLAQAGATDKGGAATDAGGPSEETLAKIKAADDALKVAMEALKLEDLYKPATEGINVLAVTSGGLNAVRDLESGGGVDPETFAALYAGKATDDVLPDLERDSENRLLYKGKLIRMYPVARLRKMFEARRLLAGEKDDATGDKSGKPGKKAAKDDDAKEE
jgi:hypothetical protein